MTNTYKVEADNTITCRSASYTVHVIEHVSTNLITDTPRVYAHDYIIIDEYENDTYTMTIYGAEMNLKQAIQKLHNYQSEYWYPDNVYYDENDEYETLFTADQLREADTIEIEKDYNVVNI